MTDNWIIRFDVVIDEDNGAECEESGLIVAENLKEAVSKIEEYYGPSLIKIDNLHYVLDTDFVWGTKETIDAVEEAICG